MHALGAEHLSSSCTQSGVALAAPQTDCCCGWTVRLFLLSAEQQLL